MSDVLTRYRQVDYDLPKTYLSWDLFGKGLENFGKDGKPVELPLRDPEPGEVLLRVDALGLCFSDTKLIWAGNEHPRIRGRDLVNDPTVPGHEAALTVVKVGAEWEGRFSVGERFIIQADIFIEKQQKAFGYVQRGAMAQFAYVNKDVLDGDDGCYLLPMAEHTGYAEAALVEPWACVEAAYSIPVRSAPKPGGRLLVAAVEPRPVDAEGLYPTGAPSLCVTLGDAGFDPGAVGSTNGVIKKAAPTPEAVLALIESEADGEGFDDIILIGKADVALVEACDKALAQHGILVFATNNPPDTARLDIGRVHYHYTRQVGTFKAKLIEAYTANTRQELKPGGTCWMIGAAGPMGQMHVQRALELDEPPAKLFATDVAPDRLAYMESRLRPIAERKGIEFVCVDVRECADLDEQLNAFTGGTGFDDIYVHAPVAPLVDHAMGFVGEKAVINIFAGVPLGTMASIPPSIFSQKNARVIGSSGSSMDDIKGVLTKCEAGKLATRMSLAALGGIETAWEGIKGVKEGRFPGKTVIWPQIEGLPLMEPDGLKEACSEAFGKLENGSVWTTEAENAFLAARLKI